MRLGLQAWGSEGDIRPFTELAAGLARNGHQVTLAVTDNEGRDYGAYAKAGGYELISAENPVMSDATSAARIWGQIIEAGNPIRQAELVMKHGFDPALEAMYSASEKLCIRADAVVGHFFVYPLRVAAEKASVPAATVNIVHNCLPSRYISPPGFPDIGRWFYPIGWKLARIAINRVFLPRVNALRRRERLPLSHDVMTETWASDRLNLIAVSPQICDPPPDWAPQTKVCGFLATPGTGDDAAPLAADLNAFLDGGTPPVFFTFGSMLSETFGNIRSTAEIWLEAINILGCRAIVQLPSDDLGDLVTPLGVFKVRRSPYVSVFPRCAVVVTTEAQEQPNLR